MHRPPSAILQYPMKIVTSSETDLKAHGSSMANQAALLSSTLPYTPSSINDLQKWSSQVKGDAPETAKRIDDEVVRREVVLAFVGIPVLVLVHFAVWLVIIFV